VTHDRPLSSVPAWLWLLLAVALALQVAWQTRVPGRTLEAEDLPPAPTAAALRLATLGEPEAGARLAMLYLQSFDLRGGNDTPYQRLDYARLIGWLRALLELDPRGQYPLFAAARIYAEVPDSARSRRVLEFVHEAFLDDPDRRWPWLAHAALLAKHRLGDLPLARRYAAAVQRHARSPAVPLWARQMEVFILEDMGELEAASIMLGGLLETGAIHDPGELRFLRERLAELEQRARTAK